MRGLKNWLF